jgi:hypothetical protein
LFSPFRALALSPTRASDLIEILERNFIKKSLGTSLLIVAQVGALAVNAQCSSMFAASFAPRARVAARQASERR